LISRVVLALLIGLPLAAGAQIAPAPAPTDMIEGGVNWTRQIIYGKGIGVAPPYAVSAEHGRALAIEAGVAIARRELLATVRGVRIDSLSTVQNAMVANAVIESRVAGVVTGSQLVEVRELGGGAVEVTVAMPVTGEFAALLLPGSVRPGPPMPGSLPPGPRPPAPAPAVIYTGLVIDARGLGIKPAMAPKVMSEGGQEVYGFSVVDRNWVIQQGMAGYSKDLPAAQAHDRVANRPLTIKAVSATGANKTDVVIANTDAQLLLGSGPNLAFLEKARVMLVVD
jgi:hypothetical protein